MSEYKHLSEEQIAIFAEALSSGKETSIPAEWRQHITECDQCAHEVALVSQIIEEEEEGTPKKERSAESSNTRFILRKILVRFGVAASVILIIGAGICFTVMLTDNQQNNIAALDTNERVSDTPEPNSSQEKVMPVDKRKDAIKAEVVNDSAGTQKPENNKIKLAYAPDKNLEKLAQRFESGSMRGDDVSAESPHEINAKQGSEILIELKNPENNSVIIEFFNNQGKKLFEKETSQETYQVKKLTEPGLYYWKLLNQDFDLIYCGKIVIGQD